MNTGRTRFKKGHKVNLGKKNVLGKHWKLSDITKKKIRLANLGKKLSDQTRNKISVAKKGKCGGEKCHFWKGGIYTYERKLWHNKNRRVIRKNADGFHTLGEWQILKAQYNWTCPSCKRMEPEIKLTVDHIIPLIKGGSDNIENIQPLCGGCNNKKYTKIIKYQSRNL